MRPWLPLLALVPTVAGAAPLTTEAERSGFERTGRYAEVVKLCADFAAAEPARVRCLTFGQTPEGRPMLALVASADGTLDAATARRRDRPVILVQGGIHAGEIEGKDAIFWTLRELLAGELAPGALGAVTVVFIPVFNVDGHERFGPNNRPNQRGPAEMGFRATAQNLNLNRDYMKVDAPEMRALLALFEEWDPTVYVNLHTTDGAKFEHDVSVEVEPAGPRPDGLSAVAAALSEQIQQRLQGGGHLALDFYPSLRKEGDPTSGFEHEVGPPRFSESYAAARNRLGILVETHSWKTYAVRVRTTRDVLAALLERAAESAAAWRAAERAADEHDARLGGSDVPLAVAPDATSRPIKFRGYAYKVARSEVSGRDFISYDETRPQIWTVPLFDHFVAKLVVRAPRAGYVIPAAHAALADRLRAHGLRVETLAHARTAAAVEAFHLDELAYEKPFEGRTQVKVRGAWRAQRRDLPAGSLYVPIAQPHALLVMNLLEPEAPDSFVAWGFFNAAFEPKEYMEVYVLEEQARAMLARDPALAAEFQRRLRDNPAFAASPEARLTFFYRRHPAWDDHVEWAPVLRVDDPPTP